MAAAAPRILLKVPSPGDLPSPTDEPSSALTTSWVTSWFPNSPLRSSFKDKTHKKNTSVGFEDLELQRNLSTHASSPRKASASTPSLDRLERKSRNENVIINIDGTGDASHSIPAVEEPKEPKRKSKAAPPVPGTSGRGPSTRTNFSYDTLKERADIWKKERNKHSMRSVMLENEESAMRESVRDRSRTVSEFGLQGSSADDAQKPKICFTKEESDKVDKDILRLMNALQQNRYPFNRDKHLLFNKLRMIRRKQMGLLFAHRELDGTGYFDTDKETFGYDVLSDKFGIMYNVIDAISRDVYELRELLYYERKNQTPPLRRGSADRRSSSEPPSKASATLSYPKLGRIPSQDSPDGPSTRRSSLKGSKLSATSPTKPILKHATSVESFKSAKSDDTIV